MCGHRTDFIIPFDELRLRRRRQHLDDDGLLEFETQTGKSLIAALTIVTQRPRDLTRKDLKDLMRVLDAEGYTEAYLRAAYKALKNEDIAATIIGFIRQQALGDPLVPYEQRVDAAMKRLLADRERSSAQKEWLERIAKQLKEEVIVDNDALSPCLQKRWRLQAPEQGIWRPTGIDPR